MKKRPSEELENYRRPSAKEVEIMDTAFEEKTYDVKNHDMNKRSK